MDELQKNHEWVCGMGFPGISSEHGLGLLVSEGKAIHGFDIVVLKLIMHKKVADFMEKAKSLGQKIIVDIDDHFHGLSESNRAYQATDPEKNPEQNREHYFSIIENSDAIITSTPFLHEFHSKRHGDVRMVRNGIDAERWSHRKDRGSRQPTVGWVGATPWRSNDLESISPFFGKILTDNKMKFHHSGHTKNAPLAHEQLDLNPRICSVEGMRPILEYPKMFEKIDIGIVPLSDVPFNYAKSYIKGLEYAAAGVPFIASATPEYVFLANHGVGRVARNGDEWEMHISELSNPKTRKNDVERNSENIKSFTMRQTGESWNSVFSSILES
jgi:glycosyltransferase involved in cell wall biosynthesis